MITKTKTVNVFIAYANVDVDHFKAFSHHLEEMKRHNKIHVSDMHATTSEEGRGKRLDDADMIVALITSNFLTSEQCSDVEAVAMHKHHTKSIPVVPVLLENIDLSGTNFSELSTLPSNGSSVSESDDQNATFNGIVEELKEVIYNL
ncbi:MAG: toll/interleukin-1 receptor domain-containing protein [Bacteroidota bacterium]